MTGQSRSAKRLQAMMLVPLLLCTLEYAQGKVVTMVLYIFCYHACDWQGICVCRALFHYEVATSSREELVWLPPTQRWSGKKSFLVTALIAVFGFFATGFLEERWLFKADVIYSKLLNLSESLMGFLVKKLNILRCLQKRYQKSSIWK